MRTTRQESADNGIVLIVLIVLHHSMYDARLGPVAVR